MFAVEPQNGSRFFVQTYLQLQMHRPGRSGDHVAIRDDAVDGNLNLVFQQPAALSIWTPWQTAAISLEVSAAWRTNHKATYALSLYGWVADLPISKPSAISWVW
jgi:hypothetical protein